MPKEMKIRMAQNRKTPRCSKSPEFKFSTFINSTTSYTFFSPQQGVRILFKQKIMTFVLLLILIISLLSSLVGEPSLYEPAPTEGTPFDDMGIDSGDIRSTRADSDSVSLVSKALFGSAQDVHVVGDLAYLVAGWSLLILDISDTFDPQLQGYYDSPGEAMGVYVEGDYAYLAIAQIGLDVVDISNPTSPLSVNVLGTDAIALDTYVSGSYVYVAETTGFEIFDISSPQNPDWEAKFDTDGSVYHITVDGDYAYVPSTNQGLLVVNVSDPSSPTLEGINTDYANPSSPLPRDVFISEPYAYVADYFSGLVVLDINDKTDPQAVALDATLGYPWEIKLDGTNVFVADEDEGLAIFDISQPDNPSFVTNHDPPGNGDTKSVYIHGQNAVLADDLYGLQIVDISTPSNPDDQGNWDKTGFAVTDVQIVGNYAYVADFEAGLKILDVSNPSNPNLVGVYDTDGDAWAVKVVGDSAYVADRFDGLKVINVANPTNPTQAWNIPTSSETWDVDVSGSHAYVADYDNGLKVIDINTRNVVGSLNTDGNAYSVHVVGEFAYLGDGDGLLVINISDPTSPSEMGFYEIIQSGHASMGVYVTGSYAYVGTVFEGMHIIDITDPNNPSLVGSFEEVVSTMGAVALGTTVYHSDYLDGLTVIDTSTLSNPQKIGYYNASGVGINVEISGSNAYLSAASGGLYIFNIDQVRDTTSPSVLSATPSNDETGVLGNATIEMTFSENMDHESVENAFSIDPPVGGTFAWNGNTITFTPNENLTATTIYSMTLNSNANDTAGNNLPNDYSWQFKTYSLPPEVDSVSPQQGSILVRTDTSVIINFSKSMNKDDENTKAALRYSDGEVNFESSTGQVTWSNDDKTMTFTPFVRFQYDTAYTFTINHSAIDVDGANLDGDKDGIGGEGSEDDFSWSFRTTPIPPKVSSVSPSKLATKVPVKTWINITFTKAMDEISAEEAFTFTHEDTNTTWDVSSGNVTWDDESKRMRVELSIDLEYDKEYTVRIEATAMDTQGITLDGNRNNAPEGIDVDFYSWTFTTIAESPKVTSVEPEEDAKDIAPDMDIVINFDKAIDTDTMKKAFSYTSTGTTEDFKISSGTAEWTNSDKTFTFNPDLDFEEDETYTITIENTVKDKDGIRFGGFSWSFKIKVNSAPVLQGGGVHPDEGDTSVRYKFSIIYKDDDDDEPEDINVIIDGVDWPMEESDPKEDSFIDGKTYEYEIELDEGEHEYYFEAADEKHEVRFPTGNTMKKLEVSAVEAEKIFGVFEEEYVGMPTMICGPLGIIILVAIIIALVMMRRRSQARQAPQEMMTFQTFDTGAAEPMSFTLAPEEEIMSFAAFEEEPTLEEAEPVVIQCPECSQHLKVRATTRPFMFPCKCGAKLILK
jgi:hypothetical protein